MTGAPGIIPTPHAADLLAVFNGGFKAMHGHYGMMVEGGDVPRPARHRLHRGLLPRRRRSASAPGPTSRSPSRRCRRTARRRRACVEQGSAHKALAQEYNRSWGTAVGGETIIRRSAIGIDKSGRRLFYALGDAVTAQSLARAMQVAGAEDAAQLDVNYSYPRFLLYEKAGDGVLKAKAGLIPDLKFTTWEYVSESSPRDFFYLTRRRTAS